MYHLSSEEMHSLLRQPESGMGYQIVDARTTDYRTKRGVVFNSELLALDEEKHSDRLMLSKSYAQVLRTAKSTVGQFRSLTVVQDYRTTVLSKRQAKAAGGANEASEEMSKEGEGFYRFSAFENDRRVTNEKSLLPGAYATTEEDGDTVATGTEAIERYALPTTDPASYRFTIKPEKDTHLKKGIVEPANGHEGGGVEVIFTDGTHKDTVAVPPKKLPDK